MTSGRSFFRMPVAPFEVSDLNDLVSQSEDPPDRLQTNWQRFLAAQTAFQFNMTVLAMRTIRK